MVNVLLRTKRLIWLVLDILIVHICLIGIAELKSAGCDTDDDFDHALYELDKTQELRIAEVEEFYRRPRPTFKEQSTQTEYRIAMTSPALHAQRKSFFEAIQDIPDRRFIIAYFLVSTALTADGFLSMRMAGYLQDMSLLSIGAFEFISGASLLAIPFLAFKMKHVFE